MCSRHRFGLAATFYGAAIVLLCGTPVTSSAGERPNLLHRFHAFCHEPAVRARKDQACYVKTIYRNPTAVVASMVSKGFRRDTNRILGQYVAQPESFNPDKEPPYAAHLSDGCRTGCLYSGYLVWDGNPYSRKMKGSVPLYINGGPFIFHVLFGVFPAPGAKTKVLAYVKAPKNFWKSRVFYGNRREPVVKVLRKVGVARSLLDYAIEDSPGEWNAYMPEVKR